MRRKPPRIDLEHASAAELEAIRAKVGQQVPLSMRYVLGPKPTLVSIEDGMATLAYPNGVRLQGVPLRDVVDDSNFWKR